jgi:hypothetical protein
MKYIDFKTLLACEDGTIFQEMGRNGLDDPQVFGGACDGIDFVAAPLFAAEAFTESFGGYREKYLAAHGCPNADYVVLYPSGFGRDGLYDLNNDRHFVVWELEDRIKFAAWLLDPKVAVAEMNNDPMAMIEIPIEDRAAR